jgi:uncharacterized NAD-dependent epimerase/dehydratase family protein
MTISNSTKPTAIVLTNGMLSQPDAKTAHGLIRGTDRYTILAVIDNQHAGNDAGIILDGRERGIPVYSNLEEAIAKLPNIQYCIIGVATVGGILPDHFREILKNCLRNGIGIVNGLHEFLTDSSEYSSLAAAQHVEIIDIRKPKPRNELHFWTGAIFAINTPIVAVIGMDCAMGKRTTCRMIRQVANTAGINAQMIYTGQTGWLQGGQYGFIFDTTINDFISGELEHAILRCHAETAPDLILLEGQSALRNPSGPCGSELLISGNAKHTILVVAPKRKYYEDLEAWGPLPTVASEIELIKLYGSKVIAIALNTEHCSNEEAFAFQKKYEKELNVPVLLPLQEGVEKIIPVLKQLL